MRNQTVLLLAVALFLISCTQPATPAEVTATAVPPTTTPLPATATTAPTPAPTATPTLTAAQLRDERATAVLTTLPGYDPARHDALLPLALALWGDEYVIDPADVAIVVGETAVQITANAAYPAGTLFVWNADSHFLILTGQENSTINRGQVAFGGTTLDTWVRYDVDGNVLEFVDPAGNWISPLDLQEDGRFTFYTQEQIGPDGERQLAQTIWWANGGAPVELTTSPIPGQSLTDYLATTQLQLTQTEDNDQHLVALADADGNLQFTLDTETGTWQEVNNYAPTAADLPHYVDQAQSLMQYDDIVLSAENARINLELGRMEYYDQSGVLAAFSAIAIDAEGRITHLTDEAGNPLLHFAAIEQLQARSHQMPVTYNGQQIETKVKVHFDHPRLMNAGLVVEDGYLDSVYRLWEQRITGLLQDGQIVANSLNPDPNAPHLLTAEERLRLRESGTFHFYVNFYPQNNPTLRNINPSPAYRPHGSSGAAGPLQYWGYYYDPVRNELHATTLMSDAFLDQNLQWRLLSYISQPIVVASMSNPELVKSRDDNWFNVSTLFRQASEVISPLGVSLYTFDIKVSGVGQ